MSSVSALYHNVIPVLIVSGGTITTVISVHVSMDSHNVITVLIVSGGTITTVISVHVSTAQLK